MFRLLPDNRSYESICRAETVSLMKRINLKLFLPVSSVTRCFRNSCSGKMLSCPNARFSGQNFMPPLSFSFNSVPYGFAFTDI